MAMPSTQSEWTVEMLDALPDDGNRYEIIDGFLHVTPSPSNLHQYVLGELYARLLAYLKPARVGRPLLSPSDVRGGDRRRTRVQPDVYVTRYVEGKRLDAPNDLKDVLLAVEVLSPSTAECDHHVKRRLYLGAGVPAYWIVDPDARTVSVWRPGVAAAELYTERVEWQPEGMPTPLVIELEAFFREAIDDFEQT
jgi:Uma2 family endonuclease